MADRYYRKYRRNRPEPYTSKPPVKQEEPRILRWTQSQLGFRKNLILVQTLATETSAYSTLQNAINYIGSVLNVQFVPVTTNDPTNFLSVYNLKIDSEVIAQGSYQNESLAKKGLAELAITELQTTCFTVMRKFHPRLTPQVELCSTSKPDQPPAAVESTLKGGIGEKMLQKMGWSGGGLGAKGQGRVDIIEDTHQIAREGLGSKNIGQEVTKILQKYVDSRSIHSIAFAPDFTKEDRAIIHNIATKFNLKSRSYGKASERTLVIQSKIRLIDLVRVLLLQPNYENDEYKLLLPTKFIDN